jgi:hypothetical protein
MRARKILVFSGWLSLLLSLPLLLPAQGTRADYERAAGLGDKLRGLALNAVDRSGWIGETTRFWYRKSVKSGFEFVVADVATQGKKPAFDHDKLAAALTAASGEKAAGSPITLEYNQRGHQVYRVIEVDAAAARPAPSSTSARIPIPSSTTPGGGIDTTWRTEGRSSGCRSGTGGSICTCTTVPRGG